MSEALNRDAFDMLCYGEPVGRGTSRNVFQSRFNARQVIKVEIEKDWRTFENVREWYFWNDWQHASKVAEWLAPCEMISPDGRILVQAKCDPLPSNYELPAKLPNFLTDTKRSNYGLLNGKFVCLDYALVCTTASLQLRRATWVDE